VNPHAPHPVSLYSLAINLWRRRSLILLLTKRDVIGRYKGSVMGMMWSIFNPIFLLLIYTFVFSVVFKARWGNDLNESKSQFATLLFVGIIVHGFFAETINRAPWLVLGNVSYVKKIIFPLEILPVVTIGAALFHTFVSVVVLEVAFILLNGYIQWTIIFLPFVMLPLIVLTLGIALVLSSLGVFIRDVSQPISVIMSALLFASPVFYPLSALPEYLRPWLILNPLTLIIEQARAVLIFGQLPDWIGLTKYSLVGLMIASVGFAWFQKTRKGFANVL